MLHIISIYNFDFDDVYTKRRLAEHKKNSWAVTIETIYSLLTSKKALQRSFNSILNFDTKNLETAFWASRRDFQFNGVFKIEIG